MECIQDKINGLQDWGLHNIEFGEHKMPASTIQGFLESRFPTVKEISKMDTGTYNHSRNLLNKKALMQLIMAERSDHLWLYYVIPEHETEMLLYHIINFNMKAVQ